MVIGSHRASHGAQAATNAARLVFQHRGPGNHAQFSRSDFVEFHAEEFLVVTNMLYGLRLEYDAVERNQLETFLRAHIYTAAAQNAHAAVFRSAFKDRIYPAVQAALGFRHGARSVVSDFDFSHAGAAFQRKHGNGLAVDIEIVERHGVSLEDFHLDDWLRMFSAAQIFINADRRALAVADAIDDEARSENAVAAGKNSRGRSH